MSTATLLRPQEKTGTWSAIFPTEQVTEQQSALFVKKLLAVAVSNITYLRAIFPEPAFGDRCLEDLNLKILKDDSMCPGACQVIKWVKGCFDALDKKYLRMLIIGIYVDPEDSETVIESYTFKFSYADQGGIDIYRNDKKISSAYTAEETKKATIRLLRTIVVLTQTLQSLPDDVMMTMKLLYHDNVTPSDYEPPGFKPAENDSFQFEEEPMNIKVGDISTPFHTVKMRIKTDSKQFEMKEDPITEEVTTDTEIPLECAKPMETEESDKAAADVQDFTEQLIKNHPATINPPPFEAAVPSQSPDEPGTKDSAVDTTGSQRSQASEDGETEDKVRCPCGCNEDDGLMILCAVCKVWQHGICFLVLKEEDAPAEHLCETCSEEDEDGKNCTDPHLRGLSPIAIQATCIWRRALVACTEVNRVVAPSFSKRLGVELTVANGLIYRLEKEGFLKNPPKGKRLGKLVNKEKLLNDGFPKYLTKKTNDPSPKSSYIEMEDPETEVNKLAEKAKKLSLSSRRQKQNTSVERNDRVADKIDARQQQNRKSPRFKQPIDVDHVDKKSEPKASRKRAISKVDENEFEISNSQDVDYFNSRQRKRKASIASKSIMV